MFIRNPEVKRELVIQLLLSMIGVFALYQFGGMPGAVIGAIVCLAIVLYGMGENYRRYRYVQKIGQQIDTILHGEEVSFLQDYREGDFAVLSTQINKMLKRLREQSEILSQEKMFLADSLADISHQIKTPLTSIGLILSFLKEEDLPYQRRYELVQELTRLTERIDWLIYALLRISKLDAGAVTLQQEKILAEDLINRAYNAIAIPLDIRNIRFEKHIAKNTALTGDMAWLTEAVGNVLKNCMEHTAEGGVISCFCKENPLYTLIRIEDTGKGIAEEDLPHIFERFYRGKNADSQSVGIGLALSYKIITSQNGTITAGNRKDRQGAVFEIRCYKSVV
ncbi:MAG: HAMP domain-containing sensor histidine kinase [Butyribacter sp.]|nr:HAMP domain-containing sensor histidine kinase [bacterium]MDY3853581.1 HAMP domain-containing sensor histidine kinase [Butyribacter sp.]